MLIVEKSPVQTKITCCRTVNQSSRVILTHLEDDPHLKFTKRFPTEEAIHIVISINCRDHMQPVTRSLSNDFIKLRARPWSSRVSIEREIKIILVLQLLKSLKTMNKEENRRIISGCGIASTTRCKNVPSEDPGAVPSHTTKRIPSLED